MASSSDNTGAYSKPEEFEKKSTPSEKWYDPEIGNRLTEEAKEFYESYTGLTGDDLIAHLHKSRDAAWAISPWPYVGQWGFLNTRLSSTPFFPALLSSARSGSRILDLGCGLGQALRYLAHRGAPTTNMYASDLVGSFWDAGYTLFRDKATFHAKFTEANALDENNPLVDGGNADLKESVDVVWMGNFLHAFNKEEQRRALGMVGKLVKVGGVVYGTQWGVDWSVADPKLKEDKRAGGMNDERTRVELWQSVGAEIGVKWRVEASMRPLSEEVSNKRDISWMPAGAVRVTFEAHREA